MKLAGARVVVTGASRGIGAELARALAAHGARVVLVARSREPLEKLAADLDGEAFPADLTDAAALEPLVSRIEADGPIDVLVNNAGVDLTGTFTELPPEQIERLLFVNLCAPVLLCRAVLPGMLQRRRGHILNVSSLAGTNALPGLAAYSTSKAGLSHFTAGLRAELKGTPITTTLAELSTIEGSMVDNLRSHEPTRRAMARLERLQLIADLDMQTVVDALVARDRAREGHVRLPKRDALFPLIVETPRRLTELLLAGVK